MKLSVSRRLILSEYDKLRELERRSDFYIIRRIAEKYGYSIDANGSNSFVMRVVREHRRCSTVVLSDT